MLHSVFTASVVYAIVIITVYSSHLSPNKMDEYIAKF